MRGRVDPIPKEARPFQGRRAGLVSRSAAAAIDVAVVIGAMLAAYFGVVLMIFLVPPGGLELPVPPLWVDLVVGYTLATLYLALSWRSGGRTYGFHVMGLRVVDYRGRAPGWTTSFLRAVFAVGFPLGLGWVVVSGANRSVQDVVLRTSVIYDWDVRPRSRKVGDEDPPTTSDVDDHVSS